MFSSPVGLEEDGPSEAKVAVRMNIFIPIPFRLDLDLCLGSNSKRFISSSSVDDCRG